MRRDLASGGVLLCALLVSSACGEPPRLVEGTSCSAGGALCVDILTVSSFEVAQAACLQVLGLAYTFQPGVACPRDGVVGYCDMNQPYVAVWSVAYSSPTYTTATATSACSVLGGTFRAP
ncbi:MAG: hypothetical protein WCK73_10145 [Deltaproteobacteria bacterium]